MGPWISRATSTLRIKIHRYAAKCYRKAGGMLHAQSSPACSFLLIIFSKHSSSSSQLGRDVRQKQGTRFSHRFIMLGVARADRHGMQGGQSAGTGQKNASQNGRAQNIHCDNVTPLGLGNWRALVSAARKPRAGRCVWAVPAGGCKAFTAARTHV